MNKNLILYVLLIFLIIVNCFFLYNYLGNREKPIYNSENQNSKKHKRSEHFLVKELDFNELQKEKYRALTKANRPAMREVLDGIRELKDALYNGLSDNYFSANTIDSLANLIGEKEKQKDILTFHHFKEVQKLCDEKQKEKFSKIINYAIRIEGRPQRMPHEVPKHGERPPRPRPNDMSGDGLPPPHH
ncbi:MAG: Spy/CpxP family protein refolding chaperone [Jejuia sp.]